MKMDGPISMIRAAMEAKTTMKDQQQAAPLVMMMKTTTKMATLTQKIRAVKMVPTMMNQTL